MLKSAYFGGGGYGYRIWVQFMNMNAIQKGMCAIAVILMGCSSSPSGAAPEATSGVRLPQAIVQLARPTTELEDLSQASVDTTVYLEGEVRQHVPLLESWLYELTDETAAIWVVSATPPPDIGLAVRVEGTVRYEPIVVDGIDISEYYLQASEHTVLDSEGLEPM